MRTRITAGKAVPLYKLFPVPCLFPLVRKASSWGPHSHHCGHQSSLWSTLVTCLIPRRSPGFNCFIPGCWKASPLWGKSVIWACLQQGLHWQGHPWWSHSPSWYRGQGTASLHPCTTSLLSENECPPLSVEENNIHKQAHVSSLTLPGDRKALSQIFAPLMLYSGQWSCQST